MPRCVSGFHAKTVKRYVAKGLITEKEELLDAAEDRNLRLRDEVRKLRKELDTARSN